MSGARLWFVFGKSANGRVDIADRDGDVLTSVDPLEAERAIAERNGLAEENERLRAEVAALREQLEAAMWVMR